MRDSNVLLPEPEGPVIATSSPALTEQLMPESAATPPAKRFDSPSTRTRGTVSFMAERRQRLHPEDHHRRPGKGNDRDQTGQTE